MQDAVAAILGAAVAMHPWQLRLGLPALCQKESGMELNQIASKLHTSHLVYMPYKTATLHIVSSPILIQLAWSTCLSMGEKIFYRKVSAFVQ